MIKVSHIKYFQRKMYKINIGLVCENLPEDVSLVHELFKQALRTMSGHDAIIAVMRTSLAERWSTPFLLWLDSSGKDKKTYYLTMSKEGRGNIVMTARYFELNTLSDRTAYSLAGYLTKIGARGKIDSLEIPEGIKIILKEACNLH